MLNIIYELAELNGLRDLSRHLAQLQCRSSIGCLNAKPGIGHHRGNFGAGSFAVLYDRNNFESNHGQQGDDKNRMHSHSS